MDNQKKKSKKKIIIICIIILIFISGIAIYKLTAISTDNELSVSMIGKSKKFVHVLMRSKQDSLNDIGRSSLYYYQKFFGITSTLGYRYDDDGNVVEISYIAYMVDGATPEKYKRNAKAIINYYTNEYNNTKHSEPNIISDKENDYEYEWFTMSGDYVYTFILNDSLFYMGVEKNEI